MKQDRQKALEQLLGQIVPVDQAAREEALRRWDSIAKPLHSLGKMETDVAAIAGIQRDARVRMGKKPCW